jgi:hypothetical protein
MNEDWKRWIFSSVAQYFNAAKGDLQILHIQHTPRNFGDEVERGEFRLTGPDSRRISKKSYKIKIMINILLTTPIGPNTHRIHQLTGRFGKSAKGPIIVKKYGNGEAEVACLTLVDNVDIQDFGQLDPAVKITQSTVEASYEAEFQET